MPDQASPRNWSEAFAALPQEVPPAHGWQRASTHLAARRRNRLPAWIGLAAAAALVLTIGLRDRHTPRQPAQPAAAQLAAQTAVAPAATHPAASTQSASDRQPETRIAARAKTPAPAQPAKARPEASMAPLNALYAESAQLESLLDLARDDRVSSAGAALLGDELDAQVAVIDASLAQPGLDDDERLRLWRARVDALRQAAGFESTQRLMASQGRSDVMLVSVD